MPDLNFSDLRQAVENDTNIPEFREVSRRARRHKRWRALWTTARVLGVLVIATPAFAIGDVVFSHIYRPQPTRTQAAGLDDQRPNGTRVAAKTAVVTRTVLAADGIDAAHTYALVDVCQGAACNLQLSQVNPNANTAIAQRTGLLRTTATDSLDNPRIVVQNASTVIVSAGIGTGPRQYLTLAVDPAPGSFSNAARPVQTSVQGPIQVVKGREGSAVTLANQPPVSAPVLCSESKGWWVVGTTSTGQLAVSVSHDAGRTWSVHGVGIVPDSSTPGGTLGAVLASRTASDIFLLVRSAGAMSLLASGDGGDTWSPTATSQVWPAANRYGLVATKSGALIAWFTSKRGTTSMISTDGGASFQPAEPATAPSAPIMAVGGGYLALGTSPSVSSDGVSWETAYVPYVSVNN